MIKLKYITTTCSAILLISCSNTITYQLPKQENWNGGIVKGKNANIKWEINSNDNSITATCEGNYEMLKDAINLKAGNNISYKNLGPYQTINSITFDNKWNGSSEPSSSSFLDNFSPNMMLSYMNNSSYGNDSKYTAIYCVPKKGVKYWVKESDLNTEKGKYMQLANTFNSFANPGSQLR